MRATVPKISGDEQKAENGLGKEIYQDMFDGELAKKMAERSSGGIGEILYNTLVRRIELKRPSDAKTMSHSETTRDSANMSDGTRVEQKHE
ncbi:MAG: rod-binding protein [Candidatus Zixiibacteriota bacterium]